MLRIHEIKLDLGESKENLSLRLSQKLGVSGLNLKSLELVKESIDARDKGDIKLVYSLDFSPLDFDGCKGKSSEEAEAYLLSKNPKLKLDFAPDMTYEYVIKQPKAKSDLCSKDRPIVVGFGPCGMFAALLLAQMGLCPLILERGKPIEERASDVALFFEKGILDQNSNVQFGEGGAGAFSDGKLTTQIKDPRVKKVLSELVLAGGQPELLYKQKPHIGTDVLRLIVKNIREEILRLGGEIQFESKLIGLCFMEKDSEKDTKGRRVCGVRVERREGIQEEIPAKNVVLALGHSARDTFGMLYEEQIPMEQKPFSMGVRIEHPQEMINETQYGKNYKAYDLGAADYKLSHKCKNGRGVYTFCMCPGGVVIPAASEEGGLVTNGMSYAARDGENANSGLLVDVKTSDFGSEHPLAGMEFQRKYERLAFLAGGSSYKAPVQRLGPFMNGKDITGAKTKRTYMPGVVWTDLSRCLPDFVTEALREAIPQMARRLRGFDRPDAVLTGVETRSSSPVRILRNEQLMSEVEGLYPGGEGAGYAGGIVSAAVDGIKIAEEIARKLDPLK